VSIFFLEECTVTTVELNQYVNLKYDYIYIYIGHFQANNVLVSCTIFQSNSNQTQTYSDVPTYLQRILMFQLIFHSLSHPVMSQPPPMRLNLSLYQTCGSVMGHCNAWQL
jgi:hypothetical protein